MKVPALRACGVLMGLFVATRSWCATELYNLDFTPPETGSYQTIFGHPTVTNSVATLTDALLFHAVSAGGEQIALPNLLPAGPRYTIDYDVVAHNLLNSDYAFSLILGTPDGVHNVSLHGGLNQVTVFQPHGIGPIIPPTSFANDQVYHLGVAVDIPGNLWSATFDGQQLFSYQFDTTGLQSIRFALAAAKGGTGDAPDTYVALDNVVVAVVPEPSMVGLVALGLGVAAFRFWRRRTT